MPNSQPTRSVFDCIRPYCMQPLWRPVFGRLSILPAIPHKYVMDYVPNEVCEGNTLSLANDTTRTWRMACMDETSMFPLSFKLDRLIAITRDACDIEWLIERLIDSSEARQIYHNIVAMQAYGLNYCNAINPVVIRGRHSSLTALSVSHEIVP